MSYIISLLSQKGGVGKSTLTMMLLNALYYYFDISVLLIDADYPQNSIYKKRQDELDAVKEDPYLQKCFDRIHQNKQPYPIIKSNLLECTTLIEQYRNEYDLIFVDTTGTINQPGIVELLDIINFFFIPAFQDDLSLISSIELYDIIHKQVQPNSEAFMDCNLIFNKVPAKNQVTYIKEDLRGKIPFIEQVVSAYTAYERTHRSTIFPMPKGKKETDKFFLFVDAFLTTIQSNKDVKTKHPSSDHPSNDIAAASFAASR